MSDDKQNADPVIVAIQKIALSATTLKCDKAEQCVDRLRKFAEKLRGILAANPDHVAAVTFGNRIMAVLEMKMEMWCLYYNQHNHHHHHSHSNNNSYSNSPIHSNRNSQIVTNNNSNHNNNNNNNSGNNQQTKSNGITLTVSQINTDHHVINPTHNNHNHNHHHYGTSLSNILSSTSSTNNTTTTTTTTPTTHTSNHSNHNNNNNINNNNSNTTTPMDPHSTKLPKPTFWGRLFRGTNSNNNNNHNPHNTHNQDPVPLNVPEFYNDFYYYSKQTLPPPQLPRAPQGGPVTTIQDFEIIKPISRGAFGRVYLAKKTRTGDYYAIKVLKKSDMVRKNMVDHVIAERNILAQISNPFMVTLYYAFQSEVKKKKKILKIFF